MSENSSNRIIGGEWAFEGQFPYHHAIVSREPETGQLSLCSGSLLGTYWVITSATCVLQSSVYEIRSGSVNFYTGGTASISRESYVHPGYNPNTKANNIGLIRNSVADGTKIPLYPSRLNLDLTRHQAIVAGWGLGRTNQMSPVLQFARGSILHSNDTTCKNNFNHISKNNIDRTCATFYGQLSCTGDSGSALVIEENRQKYLVGIATFAARKGKCLRSTSLFSGITPDTRAWINDITNLEF